MQTLNGPSYKVLEKTVFIMRGSPADEHFEIAPSGFALKCLILCLDTVKRLVLLSEERKSDLFVFEDRSSPNSISVMKSRAMWTECATRVAEIRCITNFSFKT